MDGGMSGAPLRPSNPRRARCHTWPGVGTAWALARSRVLTVMTPGVVVSLGKIELALLADIVLLGISSLWWQRQKRRGRTYPALMTPQLIRTWRRCVLYAKRGLVGGAGLFILLLALDRSAAAAIVEPLLVLVFFGLFFAFAWGGIIGVALAIPGLVIGMSYKRARRTMDDYRRQTRGVSDEGRAHSPNGSTDGH